METALIVARYAGILGVIITGVVFGLSTLRWGKEFKKVWKTHVAISAMSIMLIIVCDISKVSLGDILTVETMRGIARDEVKAELGVQARSILQLSDKATNTENTIGKVNQDLRFAILFAKAKSNSREAYDELVEMSKRADDLGKLASVALDSLEDPINVTLQSQADIRFSKPATSEPASFADIPTLDNWKELWAYGQGNRYYERRILKALWEESPLTKAEKMSFTCNVIRTAKDLIVYMSACSYMNEVTKSNILPRNWPANLQSCDAKDFASPNPSTQQTGP